MAHRRATADWLLMICALAIVALILGAKMTLKLHWLPAWHPVQVFLSSDSADALALIALAVAVGLVIRMTQIRAQQQIDAVAQSRCQEQTLLCENAAVIRACRAVARELAQPLTGALAYSEMLVADAAHLSEAQQHEVEGLREGVLRMARLLQYLREAVSDAAASSDDRSVADDVEHAVGLPVPRQMFRHEA